MTPKISILIVNYNGGAYIDACIASIIAHSGLIRYEIIIVDNHSTDNSIQKIATKFPSVKIFLNDDNVGFARGMNQAFRLSNGEYLMSFNPDAELTSGCLKYVINFMDKNPEVGKAGVASIEADGSISPAVTEFLKFNPSQILKVFKRKFKMENSTNIESVSFVNWLFGTGIVIRRSALKNNEIYPEKSFLFWEEYWLSKIVREGGFKIVSLTEPKIHHHSSVTFKTNKEKIKMARLLSCAHEYSIRSTEFGKFNSIINAVIVFIDHFILYSWFAPKLLWKKKDLDLYNTVIDYYAKFRASFIVLFKSPSRLRLIDEEARRFFNR